MTVSKIVALKINKALPLEFLKLQAKVWKVETESETSTALVKSIEDKVKESGLEEPHYI